MGGLQMLCQTRTIKIELFSKIVLCYLPMSGIVGACEENNRKQAREKSMKMWEHINELLHDHDIDPATEIGDMTAYTIMQNSILYALEEIEYMLENHEN